VGRASASYYVCGIKDSDGNVSFEAVRASQLDERMAQLKKDYIEAYRAWKLAKKEAGEDFDEPKPVRPALKKLSKRIKGEGKAKSLASLYQEKWEAKQAKKEQDKLDELEDDETT